ncbi:MAG: hypothetical protein WA364_19105 [Candidatus Nitrosopolaris sp.]
MIIKDHLTLICEGLDIDILSFFALLLAVLIFNNCMNVNGELGRVTPSPYFYPSTHEPPKVELLTKDLKQGKNVIRVNITSEAGINNCKVVYVRDSAKKVVDCVNDHNTVYKALINADPPSQTVEIYARDIYGDSTDNIEKLNVIPQPPILDLIWNSLSHIL